MQRAFIAPMRTFYAFLTALMIIGSGGCNIINPSEPVPTYVQIDSFSFTGEKLGAMSHRITNVWVYFNNSPVGNFDLPAKFPVLASAPGTLIVAPGIDYDGLKGYEVIYPLYTGDSMGLTPAPGTVISFKPRTGYLPSADLKYEELFDNPVNFPRYTGDTDLVRTVKPDEVFEGSGSGAIYLPAGTDSATVVLKDLPKAITPGRDAFIELNYKGTLTLRVGMYAMSNTTSEVSVKQLIGLKPQDQWTKIYVDIKDFVSSHQNSTYKVLIRADRPAELSGGYLLIDNIKVVSF
jgi:hypothetical protein